MRRLAAAAAMTLALASQGADAAQPQVAIVIDDIGNQREAGLSAVALPGPLTYAVLPHTPHGADLARRAHAQDKEVLVHLPMEATTHRHLGPGALTAALSHEAFTARAVAAMDSVPYARGVSNHMGSRLTAMQRPMSWLMDTLGRRQGWMFLDSRTTASTVAERTAHAAGIDTTWRDVFLDNRISQAAIGAKLEELLATAHRRGAAVAIGHPYPATLHVLARELPRLRARGVRLVPLSSIVALRASTGARPPPPVRIAQFRSGQAEMMQDTPRIPSTQLTSGAPQTITGW